MKQTLECRCQKRRNVIRTKYIQQIGLKRSPWKTGIFIFWVKSPIAKFSRILLPGLVLKLPKTDKQIKKQIITLSFNEVPDATFFGENIYIMPANHEIDKT